MSIIPPSHREGLYGSDSNERISQRIKVRQDTAENWLKNDPVLESGEFGYEIGYPAGRLKVGTGSTRWSELPYTLARGDIGPQGLMGPAGPPGPPTNSAIVGVASAWPPADHPRNGDVWLLPDPLPVGFPSEFRPGESAAWSEAAGKWIPLPPLQGPPGRDIQVFGPSPTPPVGVPIFKGDIWLATDPRVFSPTFDPSGIVPAPGPAGATGPTGLSAFDFWKASVSRPSATIADYLLAIKGPKGDRGEKGEAGETFKVEGVVANEAALPATPPRLTVYMTQDSGSLYIYDPASPQKGANGYVNLGKIAGPAGPPAVLSTPVNDTSDLPATGIPGQMAYVNTTGHLWGWDVATKTWIDGGKFGAGAGTVDDGTAQGQMLVWDDSSGRWIATTFTRIPEGNQDGDVPTWDATSGEWIPDRPRLGNEDNVYLPGDPSVEFAVPVYDGAADDFTVRPLKISELEDGPGYATPLDGDILAYDGAEKRYVPTKPPAGTVVGLADVSLAHHTLAMGETLIYNSLSHQWVPGLPAGKLTDYNTLAYYNVGQPCYHEGRIWRAQKDGRLVEPKIANGAALLMITIPGVHAVPRTPSSISNAAPTGSPHTLADLHLRWVSDADWDLYVGYVNPTTHHIEWQVQTLAKKTVWRHIALPPPDATPNNAILWIYGMPGSTMPPIVNQSDWTPINLGDFLVSLADVDAAKAVSGDVLTSDGLGRWHAKAPAGTLSGLTDVDMATTPPTDGQVPSWNAATSKWVPKSTSSPIVFIGTGALVVANVSDSTLNYGMPADTVPSPASYRPAPGDQYLDLATGLVSAFAGTVVGSPRSGVITGVNAPVSRDMILERLNDLKDVTIAGLVDKQVLMYDEVGNGWKNATMPAGPKGDKGDTGPVGPGLIQAMTVSAYNALAVKDPATLYLVYGT